MSVTATRRNTSKEQAGWHAELAHPGAGPSRAGDRVQQGPLSRAIGTHQCDPFRTADLEPTAYADSQLDVLRAQHHATIRQLGARQVDPARGVLGSAHPV